MKQRHIVLINQFYPPASAPTGKHLRDLAVELASRRNRVSVITSAGLYGIHASGKTDENITVYRLGKPGQHKVTLFAKFMDYAQFFIRAGRLLHSMDPSPDAVVSLTTPPFCGLLAARMKKKKHVPFVLWCMDLYPEALAAAGLLKADSWLYNMVVKYSRAERTTADCLISLGPDMTNRLIKSVSHDLIWEVPVWSDLVATPKDREKAARLREERGWGDDECVLLYSGNMGRAHRIDEFAALSECLKTQDGSYRFVFCGSGPRKECWMNQHPEFEWLDPVGEADLTAHLLSADIHLLSQDGAWNGIVVPSKFQAAMALEKPVLFAGTAESSIAQWVEQYGSGRILESGNVESIERVACELGAGGALPVSADNPFEKSEMLDRMCDAILNCMEAS